MSAAWGGPLNVLVLDLPHEGSDPSGHVIAGDMVSPDMTAQGSIEILDWVGGLQD